MRVTETAALREAKRTASARLLPSERATSRAPLKTSPAAVVSTGVTVCAGISCSPAGVRISAPSPPSVTMTFPTPFASSAAAAFEASCAVCTGIHVSLSLSVRLGVIR